MEETGSTDRPADLYTAVATDCIRYFGLTIEQIDRLTLPELELMWHAINLKAIDHEDDLHKLAWLTVSAGATNKQGRPVYNKYIKFFDKDAAIEKLKVEEKKSKKKGKFDAYSKHLKDKANGNK